MQQINEQLKKGQSGAWFSILSYLVLSALKIGIGWWTSSQALIADGLNNTTDVIASVAVLIGLKVSIQPADSDHPYGHYKAETISSFIAASIMAAVGLQVLSNAIGGIWQGKNFAPDPIAMWVALGAGLVMYGVYGYNVRLGKRIHSQAVQAVAYDNRSDAWVSFGTAAGIAGTQLGLFWLDPFGALLVGLLILYTAFKLIKNAVFTLTDGFNEKKLFRFQQQIEAIEGVKEVKEVRARYQGSVILVDVTIAVDEQLSVTESHKITESIEHVLMTDKEAEDFIGEVHIHVEPIHEKEPLHEKMHEQHTSNHKHPLL